MNNAKPWKNREIINPSPSWYVGASYPPKDGMYIIAQYQGSRFSSVVRGTDVKSQEEETFGKTVCQVSQLQAWREDV